MFIFIRSPCYINLRREDSTYIYTGSGLAAVRTFFLLTAACTHWLICIANRCEGLDYGRWSRRRRSRIGTYGDPGGGADALRKIRRGAVAPKRARARWGGDTGGCGPLRRRGRGARALHLRYRGAGGRGTDSIQAGHLSRRAPFLPDHRDPQPGLRFGPQERDACGDHDPGRRLRGRPGRRYGEYVERAVFATERPLGRAHGRYDRGRLHDARWAPRRLRARQHDSVRH